MVGLLVDGFTEPNYNMGRGIFGSYQKLFEEFTGFKIYFKQYTYPEMCRM